MKKDTICSGVAALLVIGIGIASGEAWLSIVTSVCATIYMITLSADRRYAFLFGMAYCITFSYIALRNALYATAIFFFCYLLPVLTASFFRRSGRRMQEKPPLHWKAWGVVLAAVGTVFLLLSALLRYVNDAQPYLDALSFSISGVTALLMLLGHKEFWITNTLGCCLSIAMWVIQFAANGSGINLIVLQVVSLAASIAGLARWVRQRRADAQNGQAGFALPRAAQR